METAVYILEPITVEWLLFHPGDGLFPFRCQLISAASQQEPPVRPRNSESQSLGCWVASAAR